MKKIVLANIGVANVGKTTSIMRLHRELMKKYPNASILSQDISNNDVFIILEINGIVIGIESQGDPNSRIFPSLEEFIKQHCNIIIVACRTRGGTFNAVYDLENHGYEIIKKINEKSKDSAEMQQHNDAYVADILMRIDNFIQLKSQA